MSHVLMLRTMLWKDDKTISKLGSSASLSGASCTGALFLASISFIRWRNCGWMGLLASVSAATNASSWSVEITFCTLFGCVGIALSFETSIAGTGGASAPTTIALWSISSTFTKFESHRGFRWERLRRWSSGCVMIIFEPVWLKYSGRVHGPANGVVRAACLFDWPAPLHSDWYWLLERPPRVAPRPARPLPFPRLLEDRCCWTMTRVGIVGKVMPAKADSWAIRFCVTIARPPIKRMHNSFNLLKRRTAVGCTESFVVMSTTETTFKASIVSRTSRRVLSLMRFEVLLPYVLFRLF